MGMKYSQFTHRYLETYCIFLTYTHQSIWLSTDKFLTVNDLCGHSVLSAASSVLGKRSEEFFFLISMFHDKTKISVGGCGPTDFMYFKVNLSEALMPL